MKVMALLAALVLVVVACGSDDDEPSASDSTEESGAEASIVRVPQDHATIQAAVDAAQSGDLVLIDEGVYEEAVDVTTADITIRGVDRNKVILDGGFELENGIRVLDTEGVVVENMTARNYTSNGFYWTGSDRYKASYLTAYRNGDYGIYAFDAYHGQIDNSYGGGSPDAGVYIGECYPCDAVIDNVLSENNGLGYSGTNSGGDLYIINSTFRNNHAGIVPNTGSYELCYPNRETTMVGNIVYGNNNLDAPSIDGLAPLGHGNGIIMAGTVGNIAQRNLVYDHDRWGILVPPLPEEDAVDTVPPFEDDDVPCEETRDDEPPAESPGLVMWHPRGNQVLDNVVSDSRKADIAMGTIEEPGITFMSLGNCAAGNTFETSQPADIEELVPCEGEGNGADWAATGPELFILLTEQPTADAELYKTAPEPGDQESMPGDVEAVPEGPYEGPEMPDLDAIAVPEKPTS